MSSLRRLVALATALWLAACAAVEFDRPGAGGEDAAYARLHPFYAEFCALSQILKRRGFGAEIRGEPGGHAVFYLNGACLEPGTRYPVLRVCEGEAPQDGAGLSMNAHFRNAKWVAIPGRAFFYEGALRPGEAVDMASYARTQAEARRLGLYDAVTFHDVVFADLPPGADPGVWKYEVSVGTDYGIALGRGRYCARVPVTRAQMGAMVAFLNAENAPYRNGEAEFRWSVFQDNCIHLAHNALAAAGVWEEWRTHRPLLLAMLNFPVPRNEFVNLMRRTNDTALDPGALYRDPAARRALLAFGRLPVLPGALAVSQPPRRPNALYETDLTMLFYDDPVTGRYQRRFDRIFAEPRHFDLRENLRHFAGLYRRALAEQRPLAWWLERGDVGDDRDGFAAFYAAFYAYLAQEAAITEARLAALPSTERPATR